MGAWNRIETHSLGGYKAERLVETLRGDEFRQHVQAHGEIPDSTGLTNHLLDKVPTDVAAACAGADIDPLEFTGVGVHSAKRGADTATGVIW